MNKQQEEFFTQKRDEPLVLVDYLKQLESENIDTDSEVDDEPVDKTMSQKVRTSVILVSVIFIMFFFTVLWFSFSRKQVEEKPTFGISLQEVSEEPDVQPQDSILESNENKTDEFTIEALNGLKPEELLEFISTNENLKELLSEEDIKQLEALYGFYSDLFGEMNSSQKGGE